MKLGKTTLLEIMAAFHDAMMGDGDASQKLRDIDVTVTVDPDGEEEPVLELSEQYLESHPRARARQN